MSQSLVLSDEVKTLVNNALASGNPMVLAVVEADGKPRLSFRGSTQVYSDDQLGLWVRNASGSTLSALEANPQVAMMYRSATTPMLQFNGRARIATDDSERGRVFENSPEAERQRDPERTGTAIIIDLDRVEGVLGFDANGPRFFRAAR